MNEFNQHVRFTYIVKNIRKMQKLVSEQKFTILDVGSGPGTLSEYVSKLSASLVSVETQRWQKRSNFVLASGIHLPFRGNSFHFVVSTDVIEHIESKQRDTFVNELLRCSRIGLIITYSNINRNNVSRCGIKIFEKLCFKWPDWYLEHNSNKIVNHDELIAALNNKGARILNTKKYAGVFTLFFTGLTHRGIPRELNQLLNLVGYVFTRWVDLPPRYNGVITAQKNTANAECDKNFHVS